jgi:hypothetical protein
MVHRSRRNGTRGRRNAGTGQTLQGPAVNGVAVLRSCVLALLVTMVVMAAPLSAIADEVIDRVLAVVGGDVITLSDVRTARELGRVDVTGAADPLRAALTQLIDRSLVLSEVNRFAPPEPSPTAVDAAFVALTSRFSSRSEMGAALQRLGIDESLVRELLSEDLRIRAYIDQRFTAETPAAQRALVDAWLAGLRRRAEIVDLYAAPSSASAQGTAGPARH